MVNGGGQRTSVQKSPLVASAYGCSAAEAEGWIDRRHETAPERSAGSFVREFRDIGSRGHGCPRSSCCRFLTVRIDSATVVSLKYLYIRCAQIGLGRGAREGVYPQRDVRFGAVVTALLLWRGVTTSVLTSFGAITDYSIDTWQVEQGLPDNSVTSIVQTPDGYLWFGTFNGLVRFDGVRFKIFDSRTPGLGSERVLRLFVDGHGALWISTEQGQLSRFAEGRFTAFGREEGWNGQLVVPEL